MAKRYANKKHLSHVHELDCALNPFGGCHGYIQAHHLMKPWDGFRGMGLKANDRNLLALCESHHRNLHLRGNEYKYFDEITGDEFFGMQTSKQTWYRSPHFEKEET